MYNEGLQVAVWLANERLCIMEIEHPLTDPTMHSQNRCGRR